MFEARPIDDLIDIASAGGGMEIGVAVRSLDDLIRLAAAAALGHASVTLRQVPWFSTDDVVRIAHAGEGYIVFADPLPIK